MRAVSELIELVREITDEVGVSTTAIISSFNTALGLAAEEITPTTLVEPFFSIPFLAAAASVQIPIYCMQEKIISVFNSARRPIPFYLRAVDAETMFMRNPRPGPDTLAVLVSGGQLHLLPATNVDSSIFLTYVKRPPLFVDEYDDGVLIDYFPSNMAEDMVVNYAVAMTYRKIEDGVTDDSANFKLYYEMYLNAYKKIELYCAAHSKQSRPHTVSGADVLVNGSVGSIMQVSGGLW